MADDKSGKQREPDESVRERRMRIAIQQIEKALSSIRFGQVTAIVQDGLVIQIERTERKRLDKLSIQ